MSTVLHLSDPHFGTEQAPVVAAALQLHAQQKPDLVIVSGDITQRARRAQFRAARDFFAQLGTPLMIVPGNHDIPLFNIALRLFAPYANYTRAFGADLQPEFVSRDIFAIALNTTRPYRHIDGEVSREQIRYVCEQMASARAGQLKIVVTHQPVHVITRADETNLLRGHREAVQAWADAGVDLVLGGHIHLPYVRPLTAAADTQRLWAVQAGTALSSRVRGDVPNSVNIIRYEDSTPTRHCRIEQWNFSRERGRFDSVLDTVVELSR